MTTYTAQKPPTVRAALRASTSPAVGDHQPYDAFQRLDSVTTTSGSATVTDTVITTADQGRPVTGTGIPAATFVGTVTAGASFLLSSSATSQVNVTATASGTVTATIGVGALTPVLPALSSGLVSTESALTVEKDSSDTSNNPVTVTCAGSDTFKGGATTIKLTVAGERLELQAASISGSNVWKVIRHHAPRPSYDARYRAGGDGWLGLLAALKLGYASTGISVNGDSTSTPDTAGFRLLANYIAAKFPAFTHRYWKWNDTNQTYDRPIVLAGAGNAKRAMVMATGGTRVGRIFPTATNIVPDAVTNAQGVIEVIWYGNSPNWITGSTQVMAAKWTSDTQVSWQFDSGTDGTLRFRYSTDGSTTTTAMAATVIPTLPTNTDVAVKVQFTPNDGAGNRVAKFYSSTDLVTWTQIGTTVTTTGAVTVFAGTSQYSVGSRGSSSSPMVDSTKIYECWINNGVGGGTMVPPLVAAWNPGIGTGVSTTTGTPECNYVLAGQPGAGIGYQAGITGYLTDPVRMPKLALDLGQQVAFFWSSHNEYSYTGPDYAAAYLAWVSAVSARIPAAARIAVTENPRSTGAGSDTLATDALSIGHMTRRGQILSFARANRIDTIDTYQAFIDDGRGLSLLISDGIHPTTAGYLLQYGAIRADFDAAAARVAA